MTAEYTYTGCHNTPLMLYEWRIKLIDLEEVILTSNNATFIIAADTLRAGTYLLQLKFVPDSTEHNMLSNPTRKCILEYEDNSLPLLIFSQGRYRNIYNNANYKLDLLASINLDKKYQAKIKWHMNCEPKIIANQTINSCRRDCNINKSLSSNIEIYGTASVCVNVYYTATLEHGGSLYIETTHTIISRSIQDIPFQIICTKNCKNGLNSYTDPKQRTILNLVCGRWVGYVEGETTFQKQCNKILTLSSNIHYIWKLYEMDTRGIKMVRPVYFKPEEIQPLATCTIPNEIMQADRIYRIEVRLNFINRELENTVSNTNRIDYDGLWAQNILVTINSVSSDTVQLVCNISPTVGTALITLFTIRCSMENDALHLFNGHLQMLDRDTAQLLDVSERASFETILSNPYQTEFTNLNLQVITIDKINQKHVANLTPVRIGHVSFEDELYIPNNISRISKYFEEGNIEDASRLAKHLITEIISQQLSHATRFITRIVDLFLNMEMRQDMLSSLQITGGVFSELLCKEKQINKVLIKKMNMMVNDVMEINHTKLAGNVYLSDEMLEKASRQMKKCKAYLTSGDTIHTEENVIYVEKMVYEIDMSYDELYHEAIDGDKKIKISNTLDRLIVIIIIIIIVIIVYWCRDSRSHSNA